MRLTTAAFIRKFDAALGGRPMVGLQTLDLAIGTDFFGDRLMVGHLTLDQRIGVRIPVPEPVE